MTLLLTPLSIFIFLLPLLCSSSQQRPYTTNHTVGGHSGWHFNARTNTTAANYTAWASTQTFSLGDFLLFNSDAKSTVIETLNATTYALCNQRQDFGNLTSQFVPDDGDTGAGGIPVELDAEGVVYFFSDAQGGLQCQKGMRFQIVVGRRKISAPAPAPVKIPSTVKSTPVVSGGRRRWGPSWVGVICALVVVGRW